MKLHSFLLQCKFLYIAYNYISYKQNNIYKETLYNSERKHHAESNAGIHTE